MPHEPGAVRPASTILLLRKGATDPIDVFMMVRHYQIEFASGALVTTRGWDWLNYGSLVPVTLTALALLWLVWMRKHHTPA